MSGQADALPDFWLSSAYHLLLPNQSGQITVTDDFLRAYLDRPEMRPVAESCAAEQALHAALQDEPRMAVSDERVASLADADARDNYRALLRFRDRLVAASSLEACYLGLFRDGAIDISPLFIDHLVHAVLRHMLADCTDPLRLRAAELLFRTQKVRSDGGAILLADEETLERHAATGGLGSLGRLLVESATPTRSVSLDVLSEENAALYWQRSDCFDTVLDLSFLRPGLDALCRVLERWVAHFLGVRVRIEPVQRISDERWTWHIGLDSEASALLNELYRGAEPDEERLSRLVSLFRLHFEDPAAMLPRLAGRPVYLGLAANAEGRLRLKPQNLLVNLPMAPAT